jgi:hypothetical protein
VIFVRHIADAGYLARNEKLKRRVRETRAAFFDGDDSAAPSWSMLCGYEKE